jgi:hypothetical protein
MTNHMYRQLLFNELIKVDPIKLVALMVDLEKAKTLLMEDRTIDTTDALVRISTDLGFMIVTHGEALNLTEKI